MTVVTPLQTVDVDVPTTRGSRLAALAITGALLLTGTTGIVAASMEAFLHLS